MNSTLEKLSPWLFTIALFVFWEAVCRIFHIDKFILPTPIGDVRGDGPVLAAAAAPFAGDACGPPWRASRSPSPSASCSD